LDADKGDIDIVFPNTKFYETLVKYKLLDIWYTPIYEEAYVSAYFGKIPVKVFPKEGKVVAGPRVFTKDEVNTLYTHLFQGYMLNKFVVTLDSDSEMQISIGCKTGSVAQLTKIYNLLNS
ncbi:MAG: hypothetical protein R3209_15555, partial [Salinimicrobium sediminis]|nr:hypothetical protein [Salinimicrobium sediminis]